MRLSVARSFDFAISESCLGTFVCIDNYDLVFAHSQVIDRMHRFYDRELVTFKYWRYCFISSSMDISYAPNSFSYPVNVNRYLTSLACNLVNAVFKPSALI